MLTLLRHGQSVWNRSGRFAGWADIDLSAAGRAEAARAGELLRRESRPVDCCFTSSLRRAIVTSEIALAAMDCGDVPIEHHWRLNERHYGALQGLRVWPAVRRYGPVAVLRCRRRFRVRPPSLDPADPRFPGHDPRYAELDEGDLPLGESVADAQARLLPYWRTRIAPELALGRHVLVVSHKHTLRALLRLLRSRAPAEIPRVAVRTACPIQLVFDGPRSRLLADASPGAVR
jgi:2,3-bisphosphoglycerate-dependent phosphoglycerate mutase